MFMLKRCLLSWMENSLKIPQVELVAVNQRTDSTKVKRTITKGQTTIYETVYRKLMIEQHEPH
jgi:hypothetical protein